MSSDEGLDLNDLDVEVPTAAVVNVYEEPTTEDLRTQFLQANASLNHKDNLVRREDHREALREAVQQERRRTLNKIQEKIESLERNIEESVHSRHELGNCHNKGGIDNLEELEEEVSEE